MGVWHIDLIDLRAFNCYGRKWLSMTGACVSVWLLVMLTFERLIFVRFPTKGKLLMTRRFALIVSVAVVTISALFTSHLIFGVTYVGNEFSINIPLNTTEPLLNGLDTITGNFSVEQIDVNKKSR